MPIGLYIQLQPAACTASRRRNFWQKGTFRSPYCVPKVPRGVASYPRMRRSVRWNYWRGGTTGSRHRPLGDDSSTCIHRPVYFDRDQQFDPVLHRSSDCSYEGHISPKLDQFEPVSAEIDRSYEGHISPKLAYGPPETVVRLLLILNGFRSAIQYQYRSTSNHGHFGIRRRTICPPSAD